MTEFAGYDMPVSYGPISEEHINVRKHAGIFDVSHMGEFIVKGKEALQLVQSISSNDASKLAIGQAQYSCIPNDDGGIVDDMLVYRLDEDQCSEGEMAFMLVVNASNMQKDWDWISSKNSYDTRLINISESTGLIAVQGPNSIAIVQSLCEENLSEIPYYSFRKMKFAGKENVIVSATGYTGSGGVELYAVNEDIGDIWDAVIDAGKEHNIMPAGLGARDTLRLEMGYCLYGNDIDDNTSPIEAGLSWITKVKKKAAFSSQEIFAQQKKEGVSKKLVGFTLEDRRVPRKGYPILSQDGKEIGVVTSGTMSPSLGHPVGMGYIDKAYLDDHTTIKIQFRKKTMDAKITKVPFVNPKV
jgi:aminomethyltransferase